ncbi:MAG: glycerol-3-phosphate acyltransferase [Lawsonibacter sp.]
MGALVYFVVGYSQLWLAALIAYFCGCFNGAVIVSKYILRDDVRTHGSGNAGLTNFFRTFGGPLTFVVILTDVLKAIVAVLISLWLGGCSIPVSCPPLPWRIRPWSWCSSSTGPACSACWGICSPVCSTLRGARGFYPGAPSPS